MRMEICACAFFRVVEGVLSSFPPRQRRVRSVLSPRCVRAAGRRPAGPSYLLPSIFYLSGSCCLGQDGLALRALCNATSTRFSWPFSKQTGASPVTSDVIGSGSAALVAFSGLRCVLCVCVSVSVCAIFPFASTRAKTLNATKRRNWLVRNSNIQVKSSQVPTLHTNTK